MEPQIIAAIVGPAATGLIAIVGIAIREGVERRRGHSAREREMLVARHTVDFIASYLTAHDGVTAAAPERAAVRQRAEQDLEAAYQTMMMAAHHEQQSDVRRLDWLGVLRRVLLIPLHRGRAKAVRVVYYLFLAYQVAVSIAAVDIVLKNKTGDQSLLVNVVSYVLVIAVGFVPVVMLHVWARRLDEVSTGESPPVGPAPFSWPAPTGQPAAADPGGVVSR